MVCAIIIIVVALITNLITAFYGKKEAVYSIIMCTVLCCILKLQHLDALTLISYTAILISLLLSIIIFDNIKSRLDFYITNSIALIAASIIDSSIMCIGLLHKFHINKCLSIYIKDLAFKFSYISILGICLLAATILSNHIKKNIKFLRNLSSLFLQPTNFL
ncbi:MAG: hypothetical protein LJI21_00565 [Wolbachia endosymbiont of Menacanthus eurysternus]|nr:MAG: hypothetical protein LJI21_00565 [Wolbachia endosymbiont of Menacanthus eurysternus]